MQEQYIPKGFLGKVWKVINGFITFLLTGGGALALVFLGAMFINVILRYIFKNPIWWFDEMVIALLVWYSALGTVTCYWTNEHAVINFFLKFFGKGGKLFLMFIPHVIIFFTSFVFIIGGMELFALQVKQLPQGGLPFPRAYYFALPMIVMGVLLIVLSAYRIIEFITAPKQVFLDRFKKLEEDGGMIIE